MSSEAIEEAYRRYFPLVREKCRRMLSDAQEASDVAQETMVRLWRAGLAELPPPQLTAWLYKTSTHLAISSIRRGSRLSVGEAPEVVAPGQPDLHAQHRQALSRIARQLPERELEVAILARVDGLTQEELAQVLGVSDRTIRRLLTRVDERLAILQAEGSA